MPTPPPLPEVVVARVARIARFDGLGVLALAGAFALVSALDHKVALALIGLAAAGAGAAELHGVALLGRRDAGGMRWLLASQPILLAAVLAYCAARLWFVPLPQIPESFRNLIAFSAEQWGMSVEAYLGFINRLTLGVVAVASVALQGGMFIYYWRRRAPVRQALASEL
ncbi:MAG: hypothetical protein Q8N18_06425 [Opitutaceae bacterium]|nr:hypothetical protein [Opitutaceae bacterium]